jgi:hypothetical protein
MLAPTSSPSVESSTRCSPGSALSGVRPGQRLWRRSSKTILRPSSKPRRQHRLPCSGSSFDVSKKALKSASNRPRTSPSRSSRCQTRQRQRRRPISSAPHADIRQVSSGPSACSPLSYSWQSQPSSSPDRGPRLPCASPTTPRSPTTDATKRSPEPTATGSISTSTLRCLPSRLPWPEAKPRHSRSRFPALFWKASPPTAQPSSSALNPSIRPPVTRFGASAYSAARPAASPIQSPPQPGRRMALPSLTPRRLATSMRKKATALTCTRSPPLADAPNGSLGLLMASLFVFPPMANFAKSMPTDRTSTNSCPAGQPPRTEWKHLLFPLRRPTLGLR